MKIINVLKKSFYGVFLFFVFSIAISSFAKKEDFILVIDAGHGGKDPGAIGILGQEKDITLAVSLLIGKYITADHADVKVLYTRDKDEFVDLWKRTEIANKAKANLFISIHTNASVNISARGSEVYSLGVAKNQEDMEVVERENSVIYQYEDDYKEYKSSKTSESYIIFELMQNDLFCQSIDFASIVQTELKSCVPWVERGVKQAGYLVLRKTNAPRILIELDFITNPEAEMYLLSEDGQKKYARAISNAFTKYKMNYDHNKDMAKE